MKSFPKLKKILRISLWLLVIGCLLLVSRSFLGNDYFAGHDINAHVTRAQAFVAAVKEGQFPVRYIGWAFDGTGSSLFNHYPIGFYCIVAILNLVGMPFRTALYGTVWMAWIGTGLGLALLMKRYGYFSSLITSIFWWFSPYAALEIYIRAAYPELLAICWGVWLLVALDKWLHTQASVFLGIISLLTAFLLITHLPTVVLFLPVLAAYFLFTIVLNKQKVFSHLQIFVSIILALGMSSFYLVPALFELNHIKNEELHGSYYDYQWHFLSPWQLFSGKWSYAYDNPGDANDLDFQQAWGQWGVLVVALGTLAAFWSNQKYRTQCKQILFWFTASLFYLLICLTIAKPVWDHLPFLSYIQYPWRSLSIASLCIAIVAGLTQQDILLNKLLVSICLLLLLVQTINWFKPLYLVKQPEYPLHAYQVTKPPYPKVGIESAYTPPGSNVDTITADPLWNTHQNAQVIQKQTTSIDVTANITSPSPQQITVKRWFYPGWIGYIDSTPVTLQKNPDGLITLTLPSGTHDVRIIYKGTWLQHFSNAVSIICWIIWIIFGVSKSSKLQIIRSHIQQSFQFKS